MIRLKTLARGAALAIPLLAVLHAPVHAQRATPAVTPDSAPEIATGYAEKAGKSSQKFMVAAANPLATQAGYQMLKQGGACRTASNGMASAALRASVFKRIMGSPNRGRAVGEGLP